MLTAIPDDQRRGMARTLPRRIASPADAAADDEASHGRIWHLVCAGAEAGSFTDLHRRVFHPGERLIDDQGNRRVVVAVIDESSLRLGVSAPLR